MANNPTSHDGYIIFGVKDEDKSICGVEDDPQRKTTQNIVDFLRDKQFHGDLRPRIQVVTLQLDKHDLDVLIVFSSTDVPYVLKKTFQELRANHIYTRIADTNTPKDKSADRGIQEKLWRKHFGLDLSPLEKMYLYLDDREGWVKTNGEGLQPRYYYSAHPEFVFEYRFDDILDGFEIFLADQYDRTPHWGWFDLYYHQTKLASYQVAALDGGRASVPTPDYIPTKIKLANNSRSLPLRYRYYIVGDQRWKILQNCWQNKHKDSDESCAIRRLFQLVLVFNSKYEFERFNEYLNANFNEEEMNEIDEGFFSDQVETDELLQPEYKFNKYCIKLLDNFRDFHHLDAPDLGFENSELTSEWWG